MRRLPTWLACVLLAAVVGAATAQQHISEQATPASPVRPLVAEASPLDAAEVEAFVDGVMEEAMAKTYAPGAIVTVVQGDRLILAKGFGVASVETRDRIDPARTLFRIASVTKLLTTAAALRLAEQGKLDLDADVNQYLTRVQIPATFSEPITARRLMTHHGGFETAVTYMDFPNEAAAQQTPAQMLRDIRRVRPVTALPLYDNMAFGVLGLTVADTMGTSYRDAMRQLVFEPLGMDQSVSGLPEDRVGDVAQAHMRGADWKPVAIPQNVMPISAQGGGDVSSTAIDMGKFMGAMLVPGKLLQPATLAQMTDFNTWRFNPRVPGLGLGMWQYNYRGHLAEGHRGEVNGFISRMALFREQEIGIFISLNSTVQPWPQPRLSAVLSPSPSAPPPRGARTLDPDPLIDELIGRFADQYIQTAPIPAEPGPRPADELAAEQLAGTYFRHDTSGHLMVRMLDALQAPTIIALPDGQLGLAGMCEPFVRIGPLYYECATPAGGSVGVGFRVVDGDRVFASLEPVGAQERQPWWRTAPFSVLPIPFVSIFGLVALLVRWRSRDPARRRLFGFAGLGSALFLVALLLELQFGYDLAHSGWSWLPVLWRVFFPAAALLLLASLAVTLRAIRSVPTASLASGYIALLALNSATIIWLIWIWGLAWPFH